MREGGIGGKWMGSKRQEGVVGLRRVAWPEREKRSGGAKAEKPTREGRRNNSLYRFWSTIVFVGGAADMRDV